MSSFAIGDFPSYPNINGPVGTTSDRTPVIAWDAIAGADSIYAFTMIEKGPGVDDNVELYFEDLPGDSTSVEAYAAPTDESLVGGVQVNFNSQRTSDCEQR